MINEQDDQDGSQSGAKFKLHISVADKLRRRLTTGNLGGVTKLPSLRELAEEFEVSTMTIRRAISALEKEGYIYRIPAVGAFIRPRGSEHKLTEHMVAFAAADLSSAFEMEIARGIEHACQQRGWGIQIFDAHLDVELETRNMWRIAKSESQAAIILPTCDPKNVETLLKLKQTNLPFVLVDRSTPGLNIDIVESNHEQGAYLATEYLLDRGHKSILMLSPPPIVTSLKARIRGHEQALADAGIEPRPEGKVWVDLADQFTGVQKKRRWFGGYKAILPVLNRQACPLAIFALDDCTGWGVYQACRELDLRIPQDVSIICFDDSDIARAMTPPMAAVAQQTDKIGWFAVELLEQRLKSRKTETDFAQVYSHIVIDVSLIDRESVINRASAQAAR